ncbi:MAG: peptidylprolyl isomerase [Bacillota bacterium]
MRKGIIAALMLTLVLAGCGAQQQPKQAEPKKEEPKQEQPKQEQTAQTKPGGRKQWTSPPEMTINSNKTYYAVMETTLGTMKIELFAKDSPRAVNNFVFLSREGFYEGTKFHRIIKGFMVQGGDPLGTGGGGPGYRFSDELPPKRPYTRGIMAMANSGPDTNGSQFFICTGADCGGLDKRPNYTQFGRVVEGLDVLEKIETVEVVKAPNSRDPVPSFPKNPPTIRKITIEEK